MEPARRREERRNEEIGGTAGKTHEQVLDDVVGRERRLRAELKEGPPPEGQE